MNVQVHVEKKTWNTSIVPIIEMHIFFVSGDIVLFHFFFSFQGMLQ